jgi:hypothetical protein
MWYQKFRCKIYENVGDTPYWKGAEWHYGLNDDDFDMDGGGGGPLPAPGAGRGGKCPGGGRGKGPGGGSGSGGDGKGNGISGNGHQLLALPAPAPAPAPVPAPAPALVPVPAPAPGPLPAPDFLAVGCDFNASDDASDDGEGIGGSANAGGRAAIPGSRRAPLVADDKESPKPPGRVPLVVD